MHKNILVLSWFNFFIDFVFYNPIAVLYFAHVTGSYAAAMSIYSIIWLSAATFEVPTGVFSDLIGRKNTVIAGALCSTISVILYAIGGNYWWLAAGALLEGIGSSFYSGNNDALLHDTVSESGAAEEYKQYYGKFNSYNQIGLVIVAVSGGIMANISYALVLWASLIPRLVLVALAFQIVEPKKKTASHTNIYTHMSESLGQFSVNRKLRLLAIISAMRTAVYEGAFQFRTAFVATLWPLWAVGIAKALSHLGAAISFHFSGPLLDRFGYKRVLIYEIIINRVINISALLFPSPASPALMSSSSLFYGATTTAVNSLQQKEFTHKQRATLGSLSSLLGSISFSISVIVLGFLGDWIGPAYALIAAHVFILSILFLYREFFASK